MYHTTFKWHISRIWIKLAKEVLHAGEPGEIDHWSWSSISIFQNLHSIGVSFFGFFEWPKIQLWSTLVKKFAVLPKHKSTWTWNFLNPAFSVSNLESIWYNRFKKVLGSSSSVFQAPIFRDFLGFFQCQLSKI